MHGHLQYLVSYQTGGAGTVGPRLPQGTPERDWQNAQADDHGASLDLRQLPLLRCCSCMPRLPGDANDKARRSNVVVDTKRHPRPRLEALPLALLCETALKDLPGPQGPVKDLICTQ